ncbi:MAG TPA: SAM-dependent methyltransferase, partial [Tissierellaceae bacterium]
MSKGKINIIGLGPGSIDQLTYGAIQKIKGGNKKFLRTKVHPTVEYFDDNNIEYISFDDYYEKEDTFDDLYQKIADTLIEKLSEYDEIDYFVPGNPMIAEKTVEIL